MKQLKLGTSELQVPAVAAGCMRINKLDQKALTAYINCCIEQGVNFFDHADIYGGGECEMKFAKAWRETGYQREDIVVQSKCGIVPGVMYDSSRQHILQSVDGVLKRLDMEYLDVLLLHRPDALVEPEEVAAAFDILQESGKVRYFGVSNQKPMQIELLKKYVKQDLLVNQLQLSIPVSGMIANGMEVNMTTENAADRDGSVLDYCRLNRMTVQAWSPFQYGFFEGVFVGNRDKYLELNDVLSELAEKYNVTPTGIATAWILRHPAGIQMIAGTVSKDRMQEIVRGSAVVLEREEWYRLYLSSGHILP